ncbi:hypothetical protein CONPUDRAFT_57766 [Coniophora puteana RWD-64-598 SS2]|uniref:N-acetyltransferase domain-containing protein n=1 Tax=Coniophora puteana (strain RWD-64-598) TaxID=741705 RepID=A0A5M3MPI8_CONPW|nr:uncharacterized protein CONPUDRAFT_57766 [Coniophora puteana RWD-64-598 SS2]EIW80625.1 hypothetical protein CONPUDRAFT_57766 [Coniophora puteana RWD-64-598 SS2]
MSAYGAITRPPRPLLPATLWDASSPTSQHPSASQIISIHHLNLESAQDQSNDGLITYLHQVFADEVDSGMTYPQEDMRDLDAFKAYFFAADVLIAFTHERDTNVPKVVQDRKSVREVQGGLLPAAVKGSRTWAECVAGYYYVKPNYPGRGSHICNAGFVVPPSQRKKGYGHILARSYLHYGPRLGYTASVFNLVYVNNQASLKLWDALGFTRAGRIPNAGRLRTKDGKGEEYVDAWVIYKSF